MDYVQVYIAKSVTVQCHLLSCSVLAVCGPSDGILNVVIIKLLPFVLPLMAATVIICGLSVCVLCIFFLFTMVLEKVVFA